MKTKSESLFLELNSLVPGAGDPVRNLWVTQFMGVITVQFWADFFLWERVLNSNPDLKYMIELGSLRGGLSLYLYLQTIQREMGFLTIDLAEPEVLETALATRLDMKSHCYVGDLWSDHCQSQINRILAGPHPILFFCDNGNKPKEMVWFIPKLSPGDIVGVHDWGTEIGDGDLEPVKDLIEPIMIESHLAVDGMTKFFRRI